LIEVVREMGHSTGALGSAAKGLKERSPDWGLERVTDFSRERCLILVLEDFKRASNKGN